ncbi:MAG: bifunctional serine/threonine-protein kinase/formylglycine-generating enzyme family protein [Thermosynechococcaceae cyanobacterium MS004]|nr:bifunctional serine/threonine-protein kinase/formylglycine-generating enzyme family protein [Thermosynechococcaceae cyanobacterium MS004]
MIGRMIAGRYKITKALSSGGMGETFIAEDTQLPHHPQCVVKRLLPVSRDPRYLSTVQRLFRSEAETLARVGRHDQIPQLLAYPEENQEFYLVQEYIEGHPLSLELNQRWSESQVLSFLQDTLRVLEFLQSQDPQVIHRDIKPDNIIRRDLDGKLVLIDFGAVKDWHVQQLTIMGEPSVMVGTVGYMPTEQYSGQPRPSSDLYAVGMIAIQALTGLFPKDIGVDTDGEKVWRHRASVSDGLADFLDKMVRHYFRHRYQTATEARQALQSVMNSAETIAGQRTVIRARPQPVGYSSDPPPPQHTLPVGLEPHQKSTLGRRRFLNWAAFGGVGFLGVVWVSFWGKQISDRLQQIEFKTVKVDARGNISDRKTARTKFFAEDLGNEVAINLVEIPKGEFNMGSPAAEAERSNNEGPQHVVFIEPFYLSQHLITQVQWRTVASLPQVNQALTADPSKFKGDLRPVDNVSWYDAVEFCARLSNYTQKTYRLPTEAEWEYACRAGTQTPFHFGATITTDLANYRGTDLTAQDTTESGAYGQGPKGSFREQTTDVGYFAVANDFGLFDMHGNAWEWCEDHWHSTYQGAPKDGSAWINSDAAAEDERVLRGGSWNTTPRACRAAIRGKYGANKHDNDLGFRVVCIVD